MRTASRRRSGQAEEPADIGNIGGDENAAGRRLGVGPRRRRSIGHALAAGRVGSARGGQPDPARHAGRTDRTRHLGPAARRHRRPTVGDLAPAAARAGDPAARRRRRPDRPRRLPGRHRAADRRHRRLLLRDRHALDDRLRRHHPRLRHGPAGERPRRHAGPGAVPDHPGGHHAGGAHRALARAVPDPAMEVAGERARGGVRLRHEGPQRGGRAAGRRHPAGPHRRGRARFRRRPGGGGPGPRGRAGVEQPGGDAAGGPGRPGALDRGRHQPTTPPC